MRAYTCSLVSICVAAALLAGCSPRRPETPPPAPPPVVLAPAPPVEPVEKPVTPEAAPVPGQLPARGNVVEPSAQKPADFAPGGQVEVYGNYETAGIIAALPAGMTAEQVGRMRAFLNDGGKWSPVHDLVQVHNFAWFATSVFWLKPASTYQVKVEVLGLSSNVLATWYGEGKTRVEPQVVDSKQTYYVAPDGADANPGTSAQPFKTFAQALSVVNVGETVMVRGGTYHEGQLEFAHKGMNGAPIVLRSAPGQSVILTGADPDAESASAWTDLGNGIYSHPCEGVSHNGCVEELSGGKITRLFPAVSLDDLKARAFQFYGVCKFADFGIEGAMFSDGKTAYILPPGPLAKYRIHLALQNRALHIDKRSFIQIDGIEFRHYGKVEPATAIMARDSADVLIQNCRFLYDDCYIYVKGQMDRLTIQDCLFKDAILGWPFGYMKTDGGQSGIFEGGSVNVDAQYSGRGLVFRRNRIEGIFDGAHLSPWTVDEARTQETDFYQNQIDGCIDDFIELDGYARNIRVFDNFMNRSLSGVSIAQALDGPTFVVYNVLGNCGMVPAAQREENYGYPFKTNGGPESERGSGPVFFYNNTSYSMDPKSRAILVKSAVWKKLTFRNNIWFGRELGADLWEESMSPVDMDYDDLYCADTNAPLVLHTHHTRYLTLKSVQIRLKWLKHGISAEPGLTDPAGGLFTLKPDSPCVDAGTLVPGINEARAKGTAPDIGAYEAR